MHVTQKQHKKVKWEKILTDSCFYSAAKRSLESMQRLYQLLLCMDRICLPLAKESANERLRIHTVYPLIALLHMRGMELYSFHVTRTFL